MASDLTKLRGDYQKAEQHAQKLMADKDQALQKVRDRYATKLRQANDQAAAAQKTLNDAEAAAALQDRPDGRAVAKTAGLLVAAEDLGIQLLPIPEDD